MRFVLRSAAAAMKAHFRLVVKSKKNLDNVTKGILNTSLYVCLVDLSFASFLTCLSVYLHVFTCLFVHCICISQAFRFLYLFVFPSHVFTCLLVFVRCFCLSQTFLLVYLFACLSRVFNCLCLPVCLIYLSVYLFACLSHIFICLFVCLSVSYIYLPICLPACIISVYRKPSYLSVYSQFALMFHIFLLVYDIYLSLKRYLSKHLCICLSIYLATLSLSSSLSPPPLYHKTLLDSKAIFRKVLKRAGAPPPPPSCAHRKPWTTLPRCTLVRMRVVRGGGGQYYLPVPSASLSQQETFRSNNCSVRA